MLVLLPFIFPALRFPPSLVLCPSFCCRWNCKSVLVVLHHLRPEKLDLGLGYTSILHCYRDVIWHLIYLLRCWCCLILCCIIEKWTYQTVLYYFLLLSWSTQWLRLLYWWLLQKSLFIDILWKIIIPTVFSKVEVLLAVVMYVMWLHGQNCSSIARFSELSLNVYSFSFSKICRNNVSSSCF